MNTMDLAVATDTFFSAGGTNVQKCKRLSVKSLYPVTF